MFPWAWASPASICLILERAMSVGWLVHSKTSLSMISVSYTHLFHLLESCPAKFILLSYSSEGFIGYEEMTAFLARLGHIATLETPYATFRGSRNLKNRPQNVTEFLFLVERF